MSGRKDVLTKFQIVTAGDMSGDVTSTVTNISYMDNISIQINIVTSSAVGTFYVQGSVDHVQNAQGVVTVAGNWVNLTLSPTPASASADNQILIDLNQLSFPYIRLFYDNASGAGLFNAFICGKML